MLRAILKNPPHLAGVAIVFGIESDMEF
jgi:hypothetical protein